MTSRADQAHLRLDKWLWYARFFKSRSIAAHQANDGQVRINGVRATKAHALVHPGDVLTFAACARIRVVRIEGLGSRRGPAPEARELYTDLDPPSSRSNPDGKTLPAPVAVRDPGAGRPTKSDRRAIARLHGDD
ncbi:MAG: ribosome-associated heat shock protein Hsp15 [Alphaproteobacteria bacterium]|jgi:ribosome-associated heat shock protein Hsp15